MELSVKSPETLTTAEDKGKSFFSVNVVVMLLLIGAGAFAFAWWRSVTLAMLPDASRAYLSVETTSTPQGALMPHGMLYLTMTPYAGDAPISFMIDLDMGRLMDGERGDGDNYYVSEFLTLTGNQSAFIAITPRDIGTEKNPTRGAFQMYRGLLGGESFVPFSRAERAVTTPVQNMRGPNISPKGALAFYGVAETDDHDPFRAGGIGEPAWWTIYLVQDDGTTQPLTRGMYPQWVSDTQLVYLANEGLAAFDITTGERSVIWQVDGIAPSNFMFHVSEDRQTIAWTTPDAGEVLVLRVESLDPVTVREVRRFRGVHGFWPVASPDGSMVAIEAVNWSALETDPQPRIEIYDVATGARLDTMYRLEGFDQTRMFLTDWQ